MRLFFVPKYLLGCALGIFVFATALALTPSYASAASCSDSWAADGHPAPWYTHTNLTLHGNSVHISCPTSSTFWQVDYFVFKQPSDFSSIFFPINAQNVTGHGSTTFNYSRDGLGCNGGWLYGTQVHNDVTGGNITKPSPIGQAIC